MGAKEKRLEIHLEDLPESFIIEFEPAFRKKWFGTLFKEKGPEKLSEETGLSHSFLYHLKNGRHSFRLEYLKKICTSNGLPLREAEKKVAKVISNRGGSVRMSFPLRPSKELAGLMGHCFGDGSISMEKREFNYVNKDRKLIAKVQLFAKDIFGSEPYSGRKQEDGTYKIIFTNLIGDIMIRCGAVRGSKVESKLTVPFWIRNGTREMKREFLRAIFDDDGSVLYTKKYPSKNVNLHFTRLKTRSKNLIAMFGEIRQMLKDLGISSNVPYTARTYSVDGRGRVVMGIFISDYRNMVKFHNAIGFTQVEKNLRLIRCLKNRKGGGNRLRKKDIESTSDWKRADSNRAVS